MRGRVGREVRTALYVPGSSPRMVEKARELDADAVILDLEDAVSAAEKENARATVVAELRAPSEAARWVRVNPVGSAEHGPDLDAVLLAAPDAIVLPMADAASLALLDRRFTEHETRQGNAAPMIVALVETCRGLVEVGELRAASGRLIGLQFGAEDFTADLGVARTEAGEEIRLARQQIAITARAHGLMAIDTPSLEIADGGRLTADARTARSVGMTGKACIHPRQLSVVAEAFRPDDAEIEWAERVMAAEAVASADGRGAFALDGRMVDAPVVARARRILTARR